MVKRASEIKQKIQNVDDLYRIFSELAVCLVM